MPMRPLTTCPHPGCRTLTRGGRCPKHAEQLLRDDVQRRGTAAERGYDSKWTGLRGAYVKQHPFCELCLRRGQRVAVAIVDHIVPHRGDEALRLEWTNLQSLCRSCAALKTSSEGTGYVPPQRRPTPKAG